MLARFAAAAAALLLLAACSSTSEDQLADTAGGAAGAGGAAAAGAPGSSTSGADLLGTGAGGGLGHGTSVGNAAPGSQGDLEVNVGDRVLFGFDSSVLDTKARGTVERQAAWLQQFPAVTVTVEGHTDQRGTAEYNLALGERRANAVKSYMTELGIDPARVLTISYGKERPADPAETEEAFAQNRRAVTVVNVSH
ncbi:MAG: peptidoglycan-associated lipoprotein Pal [Geminicoccaceae bacterium]